jgi:Family of unknown function (DUF6508)
MADGDPGDSEILDVLASQPAGLWRQLFAAADLLDAEGDRVEWTPGRSPDGALAFPYPVYSPAVRSVERLLYELGVIVASFDWMAWDMTRYAGGDGLASAPAAMAARVATAIFRGERFADGTIAAALSDGTLRAVLVRLRRWFDEERAPAWPLSSAERGLLLRIARCPLIAAAAKDAGHPCHRVVAAQAGAGQARQVPEGWAGNLRDARVVFVSSNPSISVAGPGQPAEAVETYPVAGDGEDYIAGFLGRRFDPSVSPRPYVKDSRSLLRNGEYGAPTRFWAEIQRRAEELIDDADPARNYAMTEVVHCKSTRNIGAHAAARTCAGLYLHDVFALTAAPIVVVMGQVARRAITAMIPGLPAPPDTRPLADLGGRRRIFLFTGQPGSNEPRIIARLYAPEIGQLRTIAMGG